MEALFQTFIKDADFQTICSGIEFKMSEQLISGLTGSSRQLLMAGVHKQSGRPLLVLTHNMFQAQKVVEDLSEMVEADNLLLYPANEMLATESAISSPETLAQRIDVLVKLANGFNGILVTPYAGLRKLLPPRAVMEHASLMIEVGQSWQMQELIERFVHLGYERSDRVEKRGEFSVRGGIIDIYPLPSDHPYRIEFFDIEVDSIRTFDVSDQRSIDKLMKIALAPSREIVADHSRFQKASQHIYELLEEQLKKTQDAVIREKLLEKVRYEQGQLQEGVYFPQIYKYISALYPEAESLIDYMPQNTVILIDEPSRVLETVKQIDRDEAEWKTALLQQGELLPSLRLSKSYDQLVQPHRRPTLYLSLFLKQVPHTQPQNIVNFVSRSMQNFHGQMHLLKSEVDRWLKTGSKVAFMAANKERVERLERVLGDYQINADVVSDKGELASYRPSILLGNLSAGFELPSTHLVVVTESEVFSQKQRKAKRPQKIDNAERIKSYLELRVGDYVVHVSHGIGKYLGIETLEMNGLHKDYLHIKYAGKDKLYVPIEQIELIQKYVGSEEKEPKISHLGGSEWSRVKNKVRSSVQDIAQDLIKLYAERQSTSGHSFGADTPYQREFEAMFPYEPTTDQIRAIEEIKQDMEKPVPMDRLLCGDVGYGKTEVAVRAAFKAAIEGKQVAVLVPTTILAQQHYETFRERFADYPFSVKVLSRFRTKKEQTETMKGLKAGTVDVVIGTHRLLSQDVQFKDLGLLIVDEEQRFGVSHKEKLKRLKAHVDVLTLTATPIPRTLHMSMLGVRDLSVIETPPENRFPVQTYVMEYSTALVREAVERELARGGQVYFLYNKVQGIDRMAEQISALVPEARVAVGHGQMNEQELEKTILDFLDGEYDVLVSTTIIETGVDIPNVNTLIVVDADKMGLSQLYQLRGRVGRSNRIAYAYFTYQQDKALSEVAEKRLQAIKEFTELGSGFKIAMRDLSIRGAGNLLGAEQHGFIATVGFDLYNQMLAEEIEKLKGVLPEKKETMPTIDIQLDAYIPSDYIYDSMQKIEIYKKFASIRTVREASDLEEEVEDRFGDIPAPVRNLLTITRIKSYAILYGIDEITQKGNDLIIKLNAKENARIDGQQLFRISSQFDGRIGLSSAQYIAVTVKGKGLKIEQTVELLERYLVQYNEVLKTKGELQDVAQ